MIMQVILLRHGQTEWNVLQKYQGHTDIDLNDYGRQQAQRVADYLREMKALRPFTALIYRGAVKPQKLLDGC